MQTKKELPRNKREQYSTAFTPQPSTDGNFERRKALTRIYQSMMGFARICLLLLPLSVTAQCYNETADFPIDTFNECWVGTLEATDSYTPWCPSWYNGGGFVYQFFSDGVNPVSIIIDSKFNYTFEPEGNIWAHAFITDGCQGETLWSTLESCPTSSMVEVIFDSSPDYDWMLDIVLPQGMFYFHVGNVGVNNVQDEIEGCFDLLIGTFGFLDLSVPRYVREGQPWQMNYDVLGRRVR